LKYITAHIRPGSVHLGYDADGKLRSNEIRAEEFVEKVKKLDRILSFTEDHIFITCPHETVQVWEYRGGLAEMKKKLQRNGLPHRGRCCRPLCGQANDDCRPAIFRVREVASSAKA